VLLVMHACRQSHQVHSVCVPTCLRVMTLPPVLRSGERGGGAQGCVCSRDCAAASLGPCSKMLSVPLRGFVWCWCCGGAALPRSAACTANLEGTHALPALRIDKHACAFAVGQTIPQALLADTCLICFCPCYLSVLFARGSRGSLLCVGQPGSHCACWVTRTSGRTSFSVQNDFAGAEGWVLPLPLPPKMLLCVQFVHVC
jgi:hypothetical protein